MTSEKICAAGGIVYNDKGEILWMFRRGKWDLPKGKVDEGESTEECAVREVEEETGLHQIQLGKLLGITYHKYTMNNVNYEKETYWYKMNVSGSQVLIPQAEEGIVELKWVAQSELDDYLKNTYENIRQIVAKAIVSGN